MRFLIAGALALMATPALPAPICVSQGYVAKGLMDRFGQTRQTFGLRNDGTAVFEIYANADTGTWTLVMTGPHGQSCFVESGISFVAAAQGMPM